MPRCENALVNRTGVVLGLLGCLAASVGFASRLWDWVLNFDPGFAFTHQPAPTGFPLTSSVTILLVDGLRLDASRHMPALNALRGRGADIEAQVGTPSFSRPGRASIATGAPPAIHGVTTNRQKRALAMDNLIRRVSAMGGTCRVAGSKIWSGLFGADIALCGVYREGKGKEGPGMFVSQVPEIRASQTEGLAFILQHPANLRIADIISTDFAAHEYGGTSPEYQAEVLRTDQAIADLARRLDLSKETLVVTADHGHRDVGGHGGAEPEVLAIPVVMVGAGIKPSTTATATQADIAPTVAALLGTALPAGSSGSPIGSVLLADEGKLTVLREASALQERAFDQAVADRLGIRTASEIRDWSALVHAYREARMSERTPVALLLAALVIAFTMASIGFARPDAVGLTIGVVVGVMAFWGAIRWWLPVMSFSAINYDELLVPFFVRVAALAAGITLVSILTALLAGHLSRGRANRGSPSSLAGSTGLIGCAALAVAILASWLHHGLLLPKALPGPDRLVEAYALTLSLTGVSLTSLLIVAILWALEAAANERLRHREFSRGPRP